MTTTPPAGTGGLFSSTGPRTGRVSRRPETSGSSVTCNVARINGAVVERHASGLPLRMAESAMSMSVPLRVHARYTRNEILAGVD